MTKSAGFMVTPTWLVIGGLTVLAGGVIFFGSLSGLKGDVTGALAGALLSGAGACISGTKESIHLEFTVQSIARGEPPWSLHHCFKRGSPWYTSLAHRLKYDIMISTS